MNINIDNLNKNSLIMQWNVDTNGNPASIHIENEVQQISTTHNLIQLAQIPDDYYRVRIGVDGEADWLREVYNRDEITYDTYFVDYGLGYVYFDKAHAGKSVIADYYGRGVILMSDSRIFHRNGDTFVDTWDNIMERSKDALDLLDSAGGLVNAIQTIDKKVEQGNQVADRIEDFITETEFYGYTILLSREAFVIKAKEDGNVETGEYGDIYTDVIVYKGATQVTTPTLNISLTNQVNCEFEIVGQRIRLKTGSMNVDAIKGQATVVIDCGDGLIAQRIIEVTKVFDGVSQYQVEIGNSFYSFNANSDGKIEEEQSVTCDINVTKANELYESYTVTIQNMPKGMMHNIVNGSKVNNVTFTATTGNSLPDNGTVSIVVQMADNTVISKTFSFGKTKQGVDAKSLILTGNQIVKYDTPDYTGTPSPYRSIINAQASGLSGTPNWYVLNENNEWELIIGQTGTTLEVYHNDSVIWKDRKETTVKCELDGYSDEITLIKIANGATGSDAYSILLSNEATSIPTDEEGNAPINEVQKQYTAISVYRGVETVSPTKIEVVGDVEESYRATVVGNEVHLKSISNEVSTVRIPINITVDGLVFQRVWTISKSKQGSVGQSGSTLILNIEGGTRSITYNQMNVNPRPITSASFTARLYDNGVEVTSGVGYYWSCVGHMSGTSTTRMFTPKISDTYDESVLSNQITVTVTYKGNTISNTVPIAITKDVSGIDWVTDWDSRKVTIRDTEVLTPKIFAGTYNQTSDSVTGVAIGQDVLNDGQTIGIVAYQDNTPTLLVGTDGSVEIGDPYQNRNVSGVGIGYSNGKFVGRFSSLTIAGVDVPTQEVIDDKITQAVADAQNQLKAEVEEVNSALVDLNDYVSNAVRDGILDEVEKGKIDNLMEVVKQEVADVEGQYTSIRTNQYLTDSAVIQALDLAYAEYQTAYTEVNTKYSGLVASGSETGEIAGMVTTGDTAVSIGNGEVSTDVPEGGTDDNGLVVDEVPEIGEDDVVESGGAYPQLTVSNIEEFTLALDNFRISSNNLYQVMNQALTSISESQATQITEKAKEEVIKEVNDVSDALAGLEDTMNGEFKTGLIGQMNLTNLNERLKQLDIEKKDIDGQYSAIYTHSALDTTTKNKLVSAKSKLDSAHTTLVTRINAVIADNLLTSAELEEVNNLIVAYSTALGEYSKVAQEANIAIAVNSAKNAVEAITDEDVFNKVTNFGKTQGLFIENGGKVYINAQYIVTRGFVAQKDDGTKTFEIDKDGNVNIVANSFTLTGQGNVATEDYVNSAVEGIVNKNISFSLSNEFQIIPTNATYYPFETQSYVVQIYGYKGSEEITSFTIGTVTSTNAIKAVVSNVNRSVTFTVTPNTSLGTTHGYVDIPITYEGKSYNKRWSWAVAKQGDLAPQISITGEQVFKYTNNFTGTPTPASITLTANVYNTTVTGKWQYLNSSSWVDCNVTAKTLNLQPTSYTLSSLKRVTVRYIVEEVFDTFTVVAVSDGANGVDGQDGINGQDGADGKGIASITEQYYHSTSMTTQTGGSWSTTVPTATRGKYIWTRSVIKYTDGTTTTTTPICVSGSDGVNGNNGANGTDGIGITSVDVEYAQNTSTTTAPTSGWTTTSPTWASGKYIWSRTKTTYSNGETTYTNPACITGQKGDTGNSGADAITIVLTNENHTFSANSSGNITSAQSTTTNITAYKGSSTTSVTIGTLPTVTGLTLSKSGSTVTIQANTGTSLADTGTLSIPLTIDGKSFTKNFSWTKVKAGATGSAGASAKAVDIIASSQVFKSTDGGTTFSPSTITLTPKLQNLTYSNWQYSTNGGSSWTTVTSGSNGLTISSGVLTVSKNSPLYTTSVTSIAFRVNTNDSAYYDVATIVKLYDVADVDFDQIAQDKVDSYDKTLNQLKVFNKLTNNGQTQGIYLQDSKLYINGEYIKAGTITADDITSGTFKGTNFIAGGSSNDGYVEVLDSSNNLIFKAQKGGVVSRKITFVNDVNSGFGNSIPIVTSIDQEGINMGYDAYSISDSEGFRTRYTKETKYASDEVVMNYEVRTENSSTGSASYMREENMTLNPKGVAFNVFGDYDGGSVAIGLYKKGSTLSESVQPFGSASGYTYQAGIEVPYMESLVIGNFLGDMESGAGYSIDSAETLGAGMANIYAEIGDEWTKLYRQLRFELGGGTDTANVWNQEQYNTTGNGQMLTYSAGRVYVSNPRTPLVLESSVTPNVVVGSETHTLYHTGYVPKSGNWWNGGVVRVSGDGVAEVGKYIDFHTSNETTADYNLRLSVEGSTLTTNGASFEAGHTSITGLWGRGGNLQIKSAGGSTQFQTIGPLSDNAYWCGVGSLRWVAVAAVAGAIQTSDERYKMKMGNLDSADCYDMVKNTDIYKYCLLTNPKDTMSPKELNKMAKTASKEEVYIQAGIMAQDILEYDCSKYVLTHESWVDEETNEEKDLYNISPYGFSTAIMGALKQEIQIRDEQYEELKQENKELKAKVDSLEQRLARLEALLGQE